LPTESQEKQNREDEWDEMTNHLNADAANGKLEMLKRAVSPDKEDPREAEIRKLFPEAKIIFTKDPPPTHSDDTPLTAQAAMDEASLPPLPPILRPPVLTAPHPHVKLNNDPIFQPKIITKADLADLGVPVEIKTLGPPHYVWDDQIPSSHSSHEDRYNYQDALVKMVKNNPLAQGVVSSGSLDSPNTVQADLKSLSQSSPTSQSGSNPNPSPANVRSSLRLPLVIPSEQIRLGVNVDNSALPNR